MAEPDRIDRINDDDAFIDGLVKGGDLPDDWDKIT